MQSNSATLLWANIADIYRRNFADTIHGQHCHIGWYISVCQYIGRALMETRAEFHFSWVYTFSVIFNSLRNWANHVSYRRGASRGAVWLSWQAPLYCRYSALKLQKYQTLTHFTLHCYRIHTWAIRRPCLTFVNALVNSILGRFYTARTQRFVACAWPMVLRKQGIRWKWKGESWFHYTKVLFVCVVGISEMWFYLV